MGFWAFMLFVNIFLPVVMAIMGYVLKRKPPKKINYFYGYRTAMSTKNQDTWIFANKYNGSLMFYWGLYLIPLSAIPYLFLVNKSENAIGIASAVVSLIQILIIFLTIFQTEKALKKTFDENGNKRL